MTPEERALKIMPDVNIRADFRMLTHEEWEEIRNEIAQALRDHGNEKLEEAKTHLLGVANWNDAVARVDALKHTDTPQDKPEDKLPPKDFQARVAPWMQKCFGAEISRDREERNHRFLEEALELVQACGCERYEAMQLVDYVYERPTGETEQEIGGVMVTLAALCLAQNADMHECGETELARIWTAIDKIRAKQAAKPKHSPLAQNKPEAG